MRCLALTALALALLVVADSSFQSATRVLVLFGDSLTDQGNAFKGDNFTSPSPLYYWRGRYTAAPGNWVDWLSNNSGTSKLQTSNFAYGGATACTSNNIYGVPSVQQQVTMYQTKLASSPSFSSALKGKKRTALMWAGHNDLITLLSDVSNPLEAAALAPQLVQDIITCTTNSTIQLLMGGEKSIGIMSMAPLDLTPAAVGIPGASFFAKELVDAVNSGLQQVALGIASQFKGRTVSFIDSCTFIRTLISEYQQLGFKSNSSCLVYPPGSTIEYTTKPPSVCKQPNDYVFYDYLHPSPKSHAAVGTFMKARLTNLTLLKP